MYAYLYAFALFRIRFWFRAYGGAIDIADRAASWQGRRSRISSGICAEDGTLVAALAAAQAAACRRLTISDIVDLVALSGQNGTSWAFCPCTPKLCRA